MVSRNKIEYKFNPYRREVMGALCLTKLSGTDFRVILLILAQTDGYRRTEDKIKPAFFEEKTGLSKGNVRRTVARLRSWHIISKQRQFYTVLPPGQWSKEAFVDGLERFNIEALSAEPEEPERFNIEAPPLSEDEANRFNSEAQQARDSPTERFNIEAPSASNLKRPPLKSEALLASSKENLSKENLSKDNKKGANAPTLGAQTPASKYLFEKTHRKRWPNDVQKEQFEKAESEVGGERMKEAIDWALTSGISNIKSIITAARRKKNGKARATPPREPRASGRHTQAPTHEEYLRSLPPGQRPKGY